MPSNQSYLQRSCWECNRSQQIYLDEEAERARYKDAALRQGQCADGR